MPATCRLRRRCRSASASPAAPRMRAACISRRSALRSGRAAICRTSSPAVGWTGHPRWHCISMGAWRGWPRAWPALPAPLNRPKGPLPDGCRLRGAHGFFGRHHARLAVRRDAFRWTLPAAAPPRVDRRVRHGQPASAARRPRLDAAPGDSRCDARRHRGRDRRWRLTASRRACSPGSTSPAATTCPGSIRARRTACGCRR